MSVVKRQSGAVINHRGEHGVAVFELFMRCPVRVETRVSRASQTHHSSISLHPLNGEPPSLSRHARAGACVCVPACAGADVCRNVRSLFRCGVDGVGYDGWLVAPATKKAGVD